MDYSDCTDYNCEQQLQPPMNAEETRIKLRTAFGTADERGFNRQLPNPQITQIAQIITVNSNCNRR